MGRDALQVWFNQRDAAWQRRDAAELAEGHAEDGVVVSPMFGRVQGRPEIERSYRALFEAFSDWQMKLESPLIDDGRMACPFTATATHDGDFMGLPGSGRRFTVEGVLLLTLEGTRIASERRIYDFTGLLTQVGVLRAKPGR